MKLLDSNLNSERYQCSKQHCENSYELTQMTKTYKE